MSKLKRPLPVKLFFGLLTAEPPLLDTVSDLFIADHGPSDLTSEMLPWGHSSYYHEELGSPIFRKFLFFARLIDPGRLAEIKHAAMAAEDTFRRRSGNKSYRRVNIDPGYVTEAKVVLATTKDFSHRIYIGNGMYAEVTLHYAREEHVFRGVNHTYPDFRSPEVRMLFTTARDLLREDLRRLKTRPGG